MTTLKFSTVVAAVAIGTGFSYSVLVPWINHMQARALCQTWAYKILADAKRNPPEEGIYAATLDVRDEWGTPLTAHLTVTELYNHVVVLSAGSDKVLNGGDPASSVHDNHIRKGILKGIGAGAHSASKGFTTGILEGLSEAKNASLSKVESRITRSKNGLISRFKKQERDHALNDEN